MQSAIDSIDALSCFVMNKLKLYFVDDHQIMIDMWYTLLGTDDRFEITGSAENGEAALLYLQDNPVDILITDISMPGISGIELTKIIKKNSPATKIIAASLHINISLVKQILLTGASGFISKTSSFHDIADAIIAVSKGETYLSENLREHFTEK